MASPLDFLNSIYIGSLNSQKNLNSLDFLAVYSRVLDSLDSSDVYYRIVDSLDSLDVYSRVLDYQDSSDFVDFLKPVNSEKFCYILLILKQLFVII